MIFCLALARPACNQRLQRALDPVDRRFQPEVFYYHASAVSPQPFEQIAVVSQAQDLRGTGLSIFLGKHKTRMLMHQNFSAAAAGRSHHRQPGSHRFEDAQSKTFFDDGWKEEDVVRAIDLRQVLALDVIDECNVRFEIAACYEPA